MGGGEYAITAGEAFIWKSERAEVSLTYTSDGWVVRYQTMGRLAGPPQVLHQARHRDAKLATWDVMARVNNASNEAEMVRAGNSAVQWINTHSRGRSHAHQNGVR
ncbi:MAG: hypothetical protein KC442_04245 [Thermomicrobiales bacterium]|nr:hypothetical protein [Thermomicrobiales bacterium]